MVVYLDLLIFQVLFWVISFGYYYLVWMFCDIIMLDGLLLWVDLWYVLWWQLMKVGEFGFFCYVYFEIEFFLFKFGFEDGLVFVLVDNVGYFD